MSVAGRSHCLRLALIALAHVITYPTESLSQVSPAERERTRNALREAENLRKQKKHEQGIRLLEETLARVRSSARPGEDIIGAVASYLGAAYHDAGDFEKAETILREAVEIGRAQSGPAGDFRYPAFRALSATLLKREKFDEAVTVSEASLRDVEARYGADDWQTNMARDQLALAFYLAKRPKDAIPLSRTCLRYAEDRFKPDGPETIRFRNNLATSLLAAGEYLEAKALFEQSMAIARARLRPEHEDAVNTSKGLTVVLQAMDRGTDSVEPARKFLEAIEAQPAPKPADLVAALNGLAVAYQKTGRFDESKEAYLRALKAAREKLGPEDTITGSILGNFATMLSSRGEYHDAERYLREALEITARKPGRDSETYATQTSNLAAIYVATGRRAEAIPLMRDALRIMEARLEKGHPTLSSLRHNLATLAWATGDSRTAVEEGEKALADLRERLGGDNHSTAIVMVNLGQSYVRLREFDKAEERLKRALEILESDPGTPKVELINTRHAMAELYIETHRADLAEPLCRANVKDSLAFLGPGHRDTGNMIDDLVMVLYEQGRRAEAFDMLDGARKARRDFLLRTLPGLSESEQFPLVEEGERISRDFALLLAVQRRAEPGVAARSAEWVANGKALTVRALAIGAALARDARNPEAIRILNDLNATRGRLARLALARDTDGSRPVTEREDYRELAEQEVELSRRLSLALGTPVVEDWTELAKLRAALPADAVLVEFAKVFVIESRTRAEGSTDPKLARYAAWVIPPADGGEVSLVDLGFAEPLEQAISDARAAIQRGPGRGLERKVEPAAERRSIDALQVLADRLYKPLAAHVGPARRWVLGLDAALWLVPWAALPVGEGRYAVEDHLIHLVVSGRDLVANPEAAAAQAPAILADPDYDLGVGQAAAKARELGRGPGGTAPASRGPGRPRSKSLGDHVPRLPSTADEAREIAPLMKAITGVEPEVFLQAAASESVFKSLRSPKMLVLSTHGFFLEDPHPSDKDTDPARRSGPANPLLRSGLILAGYNQAMSSGEGGDDDGLITGLEVAGCDLRGTDLVVLSACETGLGEILAGEGVAGLRQVFQVAGAKSVVASIWRVPDLESYQLMSAFFQGLSRGKGGAEALREAQLALIADLRARRGAAHPYYWAAFSLTGYPGPSWRDEKLPDIGSAGLPTVPQSRPEAALYSPMISPVTGLPETSSPLSDTVLAIVLAAASVWAGRWWWTVGKPLC